MHRHTPSTAPGFSFRHVLGAFSLGLICFLLTSMPPVAGAAEVVDRIVAVINDEIIVLQEVDSEVDNYIQLNQQQFDAANYSEEQMRLIRADLREDIINSLVNRKLVVQAAKELDWLEIDEAEIDASVERIKQQRNLTDEQLIDALEQEGMTMDDLRTQLKESSLTSAIENYEVRSKIVPTKADVTQYYNEHPEKYQGKTTYHIRNIEVKASTSENAEAKSAVQDKLANIFAELEAGQSFQSVARKYSESANASEGGELSSNFELKNLLPSFRTAVEALSPGEYTQALETSNGFQIFYVQEINKESDVPLESVYSEIEDGLYQQQYTDRYQAWIKGLRENAHIKIIQQSQF